MKKSFQLILLCILAGFIFSSFAQKDKIINTNRSGSIRSYIAPLITGDDILNVYPQSENYWTGSVDTSGDLDVSLVKAIGNGVGWMVFDISEIPQSATINSITFCGYVYDNNWPNWSITPMGTVNPLIPDPPEIFTQIISNYQEGVAYSYNTGPTIQVGWLTRPLGNAATTDLQNAIPQGWFAIGFTDYDFNTTYYIDFQGWAEANVPYLVVDFTSPTLHDVGTLSIDVPYYINPGVIAPKATVFSNSNTTETFDVTMTITSGMYSSTKTVTNLPPGETLQVTFDEWNATYGNYRIEACTQLETDPNPANDCQMKDIGCWPPDVLLDQPPNQINGLFADETCSLCATGQQTVADNFVYTGIFYNGIEKIVIWGGYYPEDIPNNTDDFTIILHADAGGQPGAVIDNLYGLQPTSREQTGVVIFGTHEYMFTFDMLPGFFLPTGTAVYWIELFNNSTQSGNFYWETGNLDATNGVAGSTWYSTTPGTSWNYDPTTDMSIMVKSWQLIPVELVRFQATTSGSDVKLNWTTATETNNQGFQIERRNGNAFISIGFVKGYGTTTETHHYFYTDQNLNSGSYTYRLKQVDFDGTFEYSNIVEVNVSTPEVFALGQNYPNPFNPSTTINFRLAVDSKVNLKVFDVLGNEVATLVNEGKPAGSYEVEFNASSLPSGVYFYKLQTANYSAVKKMVLTK
jgi:hypothetical protein